MSGGKTGVAVLVGLVALLGGCSHPTPKPAPLPAAPRPTSTYWKTTCVDGSRTGAVGAQAERMCANNGGVSAPPSVSGSADPARDLGAGTPGAFCATSRLGKRFTLDGVVYECRGPKPYKWRRADG